MRYLEFVHGSDAQLKKLASRSKANDMTLFLSTGKMFNPYFALDRI
jgi:hypothetical protein